jgi:hypothetical protein
LKPTPVQMSVLMLGGLNTSMQPGASSLIG